MPKVIDLPTSTSMTDSDYLLMEQSSGGTKKITRSNVLWGIGDGVSASSTVTSIPTGTTTNLCSLTITPGVWLITAQVRVSLPVADRFLTASISTVSATDQLSVGGYAQISNAIIGFHGMNLVRLWTVTENTPIYLVGWQNTGQNATAIAGQNYMRAVRIR